MGRSDGGMGGGGGGSGNAISEMQNSRFFPRGHAPRTHLGDVTFASWSLSPPPTAPPNVLA